MTMHENWHFHLKNIIAIWYFHACIGSIGYDRQVNRLIVYNSIPDSNDRYVLNWLKERLLKGLRDFGIEGNIPIHATLPEEITIQPDAHSCGCYTLLHAEQLLLCGGVRKVKFSLVDWNVVRATCYDWLLAPHNHRKSSTLVTNTSFCYRQCPLQHGNSKAMLNQRKLIQRNRNDHRARLAK